MTKCIRTHQQLIVLLAPMVDAIQSIIDHIDYQPIHPINHYQTYQLSLEIIFKKIEKIYVYINDINQRILKNNCYKSAYHFKKAINELLNHYQTIASSYDVNDDMPRVLIERILFRILKQIQKFIKDYQTLITQGGNHNLILKLEAKEAETLNLWIQKQHNEQLVINTHIEQEKYYASSEFWYFTVGMILGVSL